MAKPAVTLPDPERLTIDALAGVGTTRSPKYPAASLTGSSTHLQVELEASNSADYPVTERAQMRVTCHAGPGKRDEVKDLAGEVLMTLYTYPGSADLAGFVPLGGRSAVSVDPDTQNVMCWVLVRADLIATTVAL